MLCFVDAVYPGLGVWCPVERNVNFSEERGCMPSPPMIYSHQLAGRPTCNFLKTGDPSSGLDGPGAGVSPFSPDRLSTAGDGATRWQRPTELVTMSRQGSRGVDNFLPVQCGPRVTDHAPNPPSETIRQATSTQFLGFLVFPVTYKVDSCHDRTSSSGSFLLRPRQRCQQGLAKANQAVC